MKHYCIRSGFSLIEVLVAMLISSMLLVSLYQIYRQVQRSVISINNVIDIDTPLISMYNRFEIDIDGIIVPASYKAELKAMQAKDQKSNEQNGQAKKTAAAQEPKAPAQPIKKIENVFYYSASDKNFKLTFITTGGIKSIDTSTDTGGQTSATIALKPYIKRVFYTLEPDVSNPGTYTLMWGQSENIDSSISDLSSMRKFELAWGIKELSMSFGVYDIPAKEGESKAKPVLVTLNSFNPKEVFEKYKTYVPAYITIKGVVVDQRNVRQQDFVLEFQVPSYTLPEVEKTQEQEAPPSPEDTKPKSSTKSDTAAKPASTTPGNANGKQANPAAQQSTTVAYTTQKQIFKL